MKLADKAAKKDPPAPASANAGGQAGKLTKKKAAK